MKKLLLSVLFILCAGSLMARGQATFLKSGFGAKARALGNVYEANVDNPGALYWNPAGLGLIYDKTTPTAKPPVKKKNKAAAKPAAEGKADGEKKPEGLPFPGDDSLLSEIPPIGDEEELAPKREAGRGFALQVNASGMYLAEDHQLAFAGTAFNLFGGTIGVGAVGTQVSGLDGYDSDGKSTGNFNYQGYAGLMGYGWEAGNLRLGVSGKYIGETVQDTAFSGGGMDLGSQMDLFGSFIRLGAVLQDIATVSTSPIGRKYEIADRFLSFAASFNPPASNNTYIMFGYKTNLSYSESPTIGVAISYLINRFALNLGYSTRGPGAGFGLKLPHFNLDLAVGQDSLTKEIVSGVEMNLNF